MYCQHCGIHHARDAHCQVCGADLTQQMPGQDIPIFADLTKLPLKAIISAFRRSHPLLCVLYPVNLALLPYQKAERQPFSLPAPDQQNAEDSSFRSEAVFRLTANILSNGIIFSPATGFHSVY